MIGFGYSTMYHLLYPSTCTHFFPTNNDVKFESVAGIAETYENVYNYAYNYTVHQNKLIDGAE